MAQVSRHHSTQFGWQSFLLGRRWSVFRLASRLFRPAANPHILHVHGPGCVGLDCRCNKFRLVLGSSHSFRFFFGRCRGCKLHWKKRFRSQPLNVADQGGLMIIQDVFFFHEHAYELPPGLFRTRYHCSTDNLKAERSTCGPVPLPCLHISDPYVPHSSSTRRSGP